MMTTSSLTECEVEQAVELFEFTPGKFVSITALKSMLPDTETALFFGKVYGLNYVQLSTLMHKVFGGRSGVIDSLFNGDHSLDLQDYLIDIIPNHQVVFERGVKFDASVMPPATILPQVWESLEVEIATSIQAVAAKLADTVGMMKGKQGEMMFSHMARLNRQRPTLGDYRAHIRHTTQVPNLVVLDVSGSMTESTVRTIINDVVSLAWKANAHLAIVSNSAFHWEPGAFNCADVLKKAEFGGTHYEELIPLFHQDWGTVITIADYDSAWSVQGAFAQEARGHVDTVLDISLVNRPTFLSQCVGRIAREVRPILIGSTRWVLE